ncbi:MAG: helix-turn-helix domain-containing protein [archaeon]
MARVFEKSDPLLKAQKLAGKKFDLLIIDSISSRKNRSRFNELIKDIPSINPRILSTRLKDLERNGLITKSLVLGTPVKTEYALTDSAEKLVEIIDLLKKWAEKHK